MSHILFIVRGGIKLKSKISIFIGILVSIFLIAGCSSDDNNSGEGNNDGNKTIDELTIGFVPSREPDEIVTATEPLKELLTDEMADLGYDIEEVDITVGTNYEAVGEALSAGTTDVGLIPG